MRNWAPPPAVHQPVTGIPVAVDTWPRPRANTEKKEK